MWMGTIGRRFAGMGAFALMLELASAARGAADEGAIDVREQLSAGTCTHVRIELKAEGLFQPGLPPDSTGAEAKLPRPLSLDVKSRLIFHERILDGRDGGRKSVRWVRQAASAINGDIRPTAGSLRKELSLLVAERPAGADSVTVVSPAGPVTRHELELVQGLADPLILADMLPGKAVSRGASWKLGRAAALSLSDYDQIKESSLAGTLEAADEGSARIRIAGKVEGTARGAAGAITCEGVATFDRRAGLVTSLKLNRSEKREPGPVEAGLDVKSVLTVVRRPSSMAPELADKALEGLPLDTSPERQLLQLISPETRYNLLHDRRWHTFWDDPRLVVLKRLEKGRVIAQCNLAKGPDAGKGKHQDLSQFRDDLKRSLGDRFVQFLGMGEVDGDPEGGFRYKVGVKGRQGDLGVLWDYYLIAGPDGDQLLATFTLAEKDAAEFGDQDLQLVGSLQWYPPPAAARTP
ncbi:hypothetical protein OJF2_31600 [Aquisphaera giovannonii]|uniref:Uncharacterized protein n=1 Tax=Aquisphaera giovannonii TaxID=406548 RepID=A0A5B9W2Z7_9BACT|nr:hypothetical protein OJF2_31600 [Aquisphaera giovannonii]